MNEDAVRMVGQEILSDLRDEIDVDTAAFFLAHTDALALAGYPETLADLRKSADPESIARRILEAQP